MKLILVISLYVFTTSTSGQYLNRWPYSSVNLRQNQRWVDFPGYQRWPVYRPFPQRPVHQPEYDDLDADYVSDDSSDLIESYEGRSRIAVKNKANAPENKLLNQDAKKVESRNLFRIFLSTVTSTKYSTTVTATSATVINCINSSQFRTSPAVSACRRRRAVADIQSSGEDISPSSVEPLESTAVVDDADRRGREVQSSLIDDDSEASLRHLAPQQRGLFTYFLFPTTLQITIPTSYTFVTTTYRNQVTLGSSGQLLCIPSGFTIC